MKCTLITLMPMCICLQLFSQANYGVINFDKVIQLSPEYTFSERIYLLKEKQLRDSADILAKDIYMSVPHHINFADSAKRSEISLHFEQKQQHFNFFCQEYTPKLLWHWKRQRKILLEKRLLYLLHDFLKEQNITLLLDVKTMVYFDESIDYTESVINYLQCRKP